MSQSDSSSSNSKLATLLIGVLTVGVFYFCKDIILPFCLAIFLSFILNPVVRRLERLRIPRLPAVISVVAVTCLMFGAAGWLVTNQVIELGGMLPEYKGNLISKVRTVKGATGGKLDKAKETITEISEELAEDTDSTESASDEGKPTTGSNELSRAGIWDRIFSGDTGTNKNKKPDAVEVKVVALPPSPLEQVQTWLGPLVAPLTTVGIVVVLTMFLLIKREDMRTRVLQIVGTAHLRETTEAFDETTQRISSLMRMQLIVNAIYGVSVGLGLSLIGVPNALLWGVLGLLLRFLPYVGPWIVAALPITLSLAVFDDWSHVILTLGLFVALELLVNNVLEPWLYGASTGVSSVGIIVAAIFWTWLWGPVGLVLAMPFTVCLVVAGKFVPHLRFLTLLLGDTVSMTPEERLYQRLLAQDDEEADVILSEASRLRPFEEVVDDLLIPTLRFVERDRHAGFLKGQQEALMLETLRDAVDEHTGNLSRDATPSRTTGKVLCVPARDSADEIASHMFCCLLQMADVDCKTKSTDFLASEVVEEANSVDAILISAVPPGASRHVRYLCKRLRVAHPELPVLVGLWGDDGAERTRERLEGAGATYVATTLSDAKAQLLSRLRMTDANQRVDAAVAGEPATAGLHSDLRGLPAKVAVEAPTQG